MSPAVDNPVRKFVSPHWIKILAGTSAILFLAFACVLYNTEGWTWLTVSACGLLVVSLGGFVDSLICRVELTDEVLIVVQNLRRREYPRAMFVRVTWGKNVPVSLQCESGQWIRLPEVSPGSQALANTLRAWIKK